MAFFTTQTSVIVGLPSTGSFCGRRICDVNFTTPSKSLPLIVALLALQLCASTALAEEDFFEPTGLGMGGAVRVLGVDSSAIRLNPAAMVGDPVYLSSLSYSYYPREKSHIFSSGAYDSRTSNFCLGTNYAVRNFEPPFDPQQDSLWYPVSEDASLRDKRTFHRWELAAAYAFLGRRINVGLSARILRREYDLQEDSVRFSMDSGIVFYPLKFLGIGISSQNMIPTKDSLYPTRFSAGIGLRLPPVLRFEVDVVFELTSAAKPMTDIHAGVEVRILNLASVRVGYYSDRKFTENFVTWGLGVDSKKVRISYAMRIEAGPMELRQRTDVDEPVNRLLNSVGLDMKF
jgi:hypothetical protein